MIKEHVDLQTGEIHGCKKESWKWWHEKGHLVFNLEKSFWVMLQGWYFKIWVFFIMVAIVYRGLYPVAVIMWVIYLGLVIYEEWWCNQYANRNTKLATRNRQKKKGR